MFGSQHMESVMIPRLLAFESGGIASKYTWRKIGFRAPKKGEHFVSGAIPEAYRAYNDLTQEYLIVERLVEHRLKQVWAPL